MDQDRRVDSKPPLGLVIGCFVTQAPNVPDATSTSVTSVVTMLVVAYMFLLLAVLGLARSAIHGGERCRRDNRR